MLVAIRSWEVRVFCRDALQRAGYRVTTAETADAATYLLGSSSPPGIVLISGPEAWSALCRDCAPASVIQITPPERWTAAAERDLLDAIRGGSTVLSGT